MNNNIYEILATTNIPIEDKRNITPNQNFKKVLEGAIKAVDATKSDAEPQNNNQHTQAQIAYQKAIYSTKRIITE